MERVFIYDIYAAIYRERGREKENNLVPLKINVKEGILKQFCRNVYIKLYKEILRYVTGNFHNHVLDTRIRL